MAVWPNPSSAHLTAHVACRDLGIEGAEAIKCGKRWEMEDYVVGEVAVQIARRCDVLGLSALTPVAQTDMGCNKLTQNKI